MGFIISARGIELDLEKVQEIIDMPPSRNISQMRSLQSIRRFISQLEDRAQPFNNNLHKGIKCVWNEDFQKSISQIEKYFENPPILMPPILGKPLILYISAIKYFLGALLAQLDEHGKERTINYISRTLFSYEVTYTSIEKYFLAVVFSSQKL